MRRSRSTWRPRAEAKASLKNCMETVTPSRCMMARLLHQCPPQEKHLYCWAHVLRFAHEETILEPEGSPPRALPSSSCRSISSRTAGDAWPDDPREPACEPNSTPCWPSSRRVPPFRPSRPAFVRNSTGLIRSLLCTPDGTNNLAERELRPMVISRRISNGSNTFTGMETSAVLASVVQTASKHPDQMLATLQRQLQEGVHEHFPHSLHPVCLDLPNFPSLLFL